MLFSLYGCDIITEILGHAWVAAVGQAATPPFTSLLGGVPLSAAIDDDLQLEENTNMVDEALDLPPDVVVEDDMSSTGSMEDSSDDDEGIVDGDLGENGACSNDAFSALESLALRHDVNLLHAQLLGGALEDEQAGEAAVLEEALMEVEPDPAVGSAHAVDAEVRMGSQGANQGPPVVRKRTGEAFKIPLARLVLCQGGAAASVAWVPQQGCEMTLFVSPHFNHLQVKLTCDHPKQSDVVTWSMLSILSLSLVKTPADNAGARAAAAGEQSDNTSFGSLVMAVCAEPKSQSRAVRAFAATESALAEAPSAFNVRAASYPAMLQREQDISDHTVATYRAAIAALPAATGRVNKAVDCSVIGVQMTHVQFVFAAPLEGESATLWERALPALSPSLVGRVQPACDAQDLPSVPANMMPSQMNIHQYQSDVVTCKISPLHAKKGAERIALITRTKDLFAMFNTRHNPGAFSQLTYTCGLCDNELGLELGTIIFHHEACEYKDNEARIRQRHIEPGLQQGMAAPEFQDLDEVAQEPDVPDE
jgi:hypothetical protein